MQNQAVVLRHNEGIYGAADAGETALPLAAGALADGAGLNATTVILSPELSNHYGRSSVCFCATLHTQTLSAYGKHVHSLGLKREGLWRCEEKVCPTTPSFSCLLHLSRSGCAKKHQSLPKKTEQWGSTRGFYKKNVSVGAPTIHRMNVSLLPLEFLKLYLSTDLPSVSCLCDITFPEENGHANCKVTWRGAKTNYTWMTSFSGSEKKKTNTSFKSVVGSFKLFQHWHHSHASLPFSLIHFTNVASDWVQRGCSHIHSSDPFVLGNRTPHSWFSFSRLWWQIMEPDLLSVSTLLFFYEQLLQVSQWSLWPPDEFLCFMSLILQVVWASLWSL